MIEYKVISETASSLDSVQVRVIDGSSVYTLTISQLQSDKAYLTNQKMIAVAQYDAKIAKLETMIAEMTELVKDVAIIEPPIEEEVE
jgi:hypothetical protein